MSTYLTCEVDELLNEADVRDRCGDDEDPPLLLPIVGNGNVVVSCQSKRQSEEIDFPPVPRQLRVIEEDQETNEVTPPGDGRRVRKVAGVNGSHCWAAPALQYALKDAGIDPDAPETHIIDANMRSRSSTQNYNTYPFNASSVKFETNAVGAMIDRLATIYLQDEPETDDTPSIVMDSAKWHAAYSMRDSQVLWATRPLKDFYELYFMSRGPAFVHIFNTYQTRFSGENAQSLSEEDNMSFTAANAELLPVGDLQVYLFDEVAFTKTIWEADLNAVQSIVRNFSQSAFESISEQFMGEAQRISFDTAFSLVADGELRALSEMRRKPRVSQQKSFELICEYVLVDSKKQQRDSYTAAQIRALIVEEHREVFESIEYLTEQMPYENVVLIADFEKALDWLYKGQEKWCNGGGRNVHTQPYTSRETGEPIVSLLSYIMSYDGVSWGVSPLDIRFVKPYLMHMTKIASFNLFDNARLPPSLQRESWRDTITMRAILAFKHRFRETLDISGSAEATNRVQPFSFDDAPDVGPSAAVRPSTEFVYTTFSFGDARDVRPSAAVRPSTEFVYTYLKSIEGMLRQQTYGIMVRNRGRALASLPPVVYESDLSLYEVVMHILSLPYDDRTTSPRVTDIYDAGPRRRAVGRDEEMEALTNDTDNIWGQNILGLDGNETVDAGRLSTAKFFSRSGFWNTWRHAPDCGIREDGLSQPFKGFHLFSLDVTTNMSPVTAGVDDVNLDLPSGSRIEEEDAELVTVEVTYPDDSNFDKYKDDIAFVGSSITLQRTSIPDFDDSTWFKVHDMTKRSLPDGFTYEEAEKKTFTKTYECPAGLIIWSTLVEYILDFERTSGHRSHKSWFGGIDANWVDFESLDFVPNLNGDRGSTYNINYGSSAGSVENLIKMQEIANI
jgi:hypothetical protein